MTYDDTEEQPLDPVMERVRKKMIRLMIISTGIMMIGLLAVLFAIIYKFSNPSVKSGDETARVPSDPVEINLGLGADIQINSVTVHSDQVIFDVEETGRKRRVIIVDSRTGQIISRINVN
ncbi:MAG: hypothetical protein ACR2O3_01445 [Rhizobiaceae bacterium]